MALRIDSVATTALQASGVEARRPDSPRRRDADGAQPGGRVGAAVAERDFMPGPGLPGRISASGGVRELRLQRIADFDTAADTGGSLRTGARAYLAVERNTITDSAGGELVGIDIFV